MHGILTTMMWQQMWVFMSHEATLLVHRVVCELTKQFTQSLFMTGLKLAECMFADRRQAWAWNRLLLSRGFFLSSMITSRPSWGWAIFLACLVTTATSVVPLRLRPTNSLPEMFSMLGCFLQSTQACFRPFILKLFDRCGIYLQWSVLLLIPTC